MDIPTGFSLKSEDFQPTDFSNTDSFKSFHSSLASWLSQPTVFLAHACGLTVTTIPCVATTQQYINMESITSTRSPLPAAVNWTSGESYQYSTTTVYISCSQRWHICTKGLHFSAFILNNHEACQGRGIPTTLGCALTEGRTSHTTTHRPVGSAEEATSTHQCLPMPRLNHTQTV